MVYMERKLSHLGIVSGIIGRCFLPVTCRRRHSRPQVPLPSGKWGEVGGSLRFLVDARSLGGAGFAWSSPVFYLGVPASPAPCMPRGVEGTWHPLGRFLLAPAVGPRRAGRCLRSQGAAAASTHFMGSQFLIVIRAWSGGVRTTGKGTGA